jgi:hypothetical protein
MTPRAAGSASLSPDNDTPRVCDSELEEHIGREHKFIPRKPPRKCDLLKCDGCRAAKLKVRQLYITL